MFLSLNTTKIFKTNHSVLKTIQNETLCRSLKTSGQFWAHRIFLVFCEKGTFNTCWTVCNYLSECRAPPFRFNCDCFCAALQDLINIFFAEFRAFILFIHNGAIRTSSKQVFNFLFGKLLNLKKQDLDTFKRGRKIILFTHGLA